MQICAFWINPMMTGIAPLEYCFNDVKELRDFSEP